MDAAYAADIARAVGAAAWKLASLGSVPDFEAALTDNKDSAKPQSFETWRSKLPKVTVDGVGYFVLHGDELRDEAEIRTLWEKRHASSDAEQPAQSGKPLRFLDVSPDTPANEAEAPKSKPSENNL